MKERLDLTDLQICWLYVYPSGNHTDSSFFSISCVVSPIDCKELNTKSYGLGRCLTGVKYLANPTRNWLLSLVIRTRNFFLSEQVDIWNVSFHNNAYPHRISDPPTKIFRNVTSTGLHFAGNLTLLFFGEKQPKTKTKKKITKKKSEPPTSS